MPGTAAPLVNLLRHDDAAQTKGYLAAMNDQDTSLLSDAQLIACIATRRQEALSVLYDRFSKLLYGLILAIVRDTDDAEDILQEVFIQVWKNASRYQPLLGAPKTWLVRLAHNRAIDLLRSKRHKQKQLEVRDVLKTEQDGRPLMQAEDTTWRQTVRQEQTGQISLALSSLPCEQRVLIEMAFLNGYTHQEIALHTGLPLGTVKTRIRSAMQTLRSRLRSVAEEI